MKELTAAEKILKEWNGGVLRDAKTKLAKELRLPTSNISNWLHGRQEPAEKAVVKMAKLFGKSEKEVKNAFAGAEKTQPIQKIVKNKDCNISQVIHSVEAEVLKGQMKVLEAKMDLIIQILKGK